MSYHINIGYTDRIFRMLVRWIEVQCNFSLLFRKSIGMQYHKIAFMFVGRRGHK